jgi:hypothetical protein
LEEGTNAFDVGAEPCADDDEVAVLDEPDGDVRDVDVVREVERAVKASGWRGLGGHSSTNAIGMWSPWRARSQRHSRQRV